MAKSTQPPAWTAVKAAEKRTPSEATTPERRPVRRSEPEGVDCTLEPPVAEGHPGATRGDLRSDLELGFVFELEITDVDEPQDDGGRDRRAAHTEEHVREQLLVATAVPLVERAG